MSIESNKQAAPASRVVADMSKPKLGYLLFDLPGDHEIEASLTTECKLIESLIHNMRMSARIKRICVASTDRFCKYPTYRYRVQFVHLACHGDRTGISVLGGSMRWREMAAQITRYLHPLSADQKRVMVFSCCHSENGFRATRELFVPYFTGAYYFSREKIAFSQAIAVWAMFYLKKKLNKPHGAIAKAINQFMGENLLQFNDYSGA